MSSKPTITAFKSSCDKLRSNLTSYTNKKVKIKLPKKVVISKKWHQNCSHEVKSRSAGVIDSNATEKSANPKKVTKSESTMPRNAKTIDICKKCGDTDDDITTAVSEYTETSQFTSKSNEADTKKVEKSPENANIIEKQQYTVQEYYKNENFGGYIKITDSTSNTKLNLQNDSKNDKISNKKDGKEKEIIEEYYKNENFEDLYDSMHDIDNGLRNLATLDTIAEVNEKQTLSDQSADSIYILESSDDDVNVKKLKDFREKNYFECHSAKTRVKTKGSATSLREHRCNYRFYLNDRLFPVAVNSDHNDNIRCVDCHLPLNLPTDKVKLNGTIQAKVKLGGETQDMTLLLPVTKPLIIQQRKKEKNDSEIVYFGLIKLDQNGNSVFKRSLPRDSLALKYQKGYREFDSARSYLYDKVEEGDVIVI